MSEVTVTRCDKCEKFEEKAETTKVMLSPNDDSDEAESVNPPHEFDVCPKCREKLLKWFGIGA